MSALGVPPPRVTVNTASLPSCTAAPGPPTLTVVSSLAAMVAVFAASAGVAVMPTFAPLADTKRTTMVSSPSFRPSLFRAMPISAMTPFMAMAVVKAEGVV